MGGSNVQFVLRSILNDTLPTYIYIYTEFDAKTSIQSMSGLAWALREVDAGAAAGVLPKFTMTLACRKLM